MTRSVVITADDLGREPGTTEVIASLLAEGHASATTLITVSPAAEDAALRMTQIGIRPHLHVTLTTERGQPRWRAMSGVSSITDADGTLTDDLYALAARAQPGDAIREAGAQLEWMRSRGFSPVAADSHSGTLYGLHGGPWAGQILGMTLRWCARNGFAFRLPRDPLPYFGTALPPELARLHEQAVALADELGVAIPQTISTNRRAASDLGSYEGLREAYVRQLPNLPEGTSELFLHPSHEDAVTDPDGIVRVWEARLLRDPVWHEALRADGIDVVPEWTRP
jgi:chitin disaccharide deacetylase